VYNGRNMVVITSTDIVDDCLCAKTTQKLFTQSYIHAVLLSCMFSIFEYNLYFSGTFTNKRYKKISDNPLRHIFHLKFPKI